MAEMALVSADYRKGELYTTSRVVAEELGLDHESVMALIHKHEELKGSDLKSEPIQTAGGIQTSKYAVLNEEQAYILLTFAKNTPKARAVKVQFVKAFIAMRKELESRKAIKGDSTGIRNVLTDQWKRHGANGKHHYINLTKASYNVLGFTTGLKKADMGTAEIVKLIALESNEAVKLMQTDDIHGYYELRDSLIRTGASITGPVRKEIPA